MANNMDLMKEIGFWLSTIGRVGTADLIVGGDDAKDLRATLQRARDALRWIPVTERLPEEERLYWVTCRRPRRVKGWPEIFCTQLAFDKTRGAFIEGEDKVLAWLEWPAPYTPEEK